MFCQFTTFYHDVNHVPYLGEIPFKGASSQVWITWAQRPWDACGMAFQCLSGQVLAHWIAICRRHHGGPQSGHPVLSDSLQIVSISELPPWFWVRGSPVVHTNVVIVEAFVGFGKLCLSVAKDYHPNALLHLQEPRQNPTMRRYFAVSTLSQADMRSMQSSSWTFCTDAAILLPVDW